MPFPSVAATEDPGELPTYCLDAIRDELGRIPETELLSISADPVAASIIVRGAAPEIRTHRAAIEALCGTERAQLVDRLELLARALHAAHGQYLVPEDAPDVAAISKAAVEHRAVLVADAASLVHRGVLAREQLACLRGVRGYKDQVFDLLMLVSIFQHDWPAIEGKSPVSRADLGRAEGLANQLAMAVGARRFPPPSARAALRQRAYTLLVRTYDEVRRMLSYVRWHEGDVAQIAPSLFAQRKRRKRAAPVEGPVEGAAVVVRDDHVAAAPGMPGSSPFIDA